MQALRFLLLVLIFTVTFSFLANASWATPFFGDGSDGDVTISGTVNLDGVVKQYNNLIINSGATLTTSSNSYPVLIIYVKDTLTVNGVISMNGRGGSGGGGGAGSPANQNSASPGSVGGAGAYIGATGTGGGGGGTNSNGGAGGAGAGGGGGGGGLVADGGAAGANGRDKTETDSSVINALLSLLPDKIDNTLKAGSGGGGGGGGGAAQTAGGGNGGAGGAGGGIIMILAKKIINNGIISAKGLAGENGFAGGTVLQYVGSGGGGGGGGGSGGVVYLAYSSLSGSGTISVSGGAGGAGGTRGDTAGNGGAGGAGAYGRVYIFKGPLFYQTDWSGGPSTEKTNLSYGWGKFNDSANINFLAGTLKLETLWMWTQLSPSGTLPQRRGWYSAVWTGSAMLVFGGLCPGVGCYLNDLWAYTPSTNSWAQLASGASARAYPTAVWTGSDMLVFGGKDITGANLNDLWKYSTSTNSWTKLSPSGTLPSAGYGHSAVWTGSAMLVFGSGASNDLWTYTPSTNSWSKLFPSGALPSARSLHSAVWTGSDMLVFGGYNTTNYMYLNDLWKYSTSTNSWTKLSPSGTLPSAGYGHSAVWTGSDMLVFGGYYAGYLNDLWAYTPSTNSWAQLSPSGSLPSGRSGCSAVWNDSAMLMFSGSGASNDLWMAYSSLQSQGNITSSIFDSGSNDTIWGNISWSASLPFKTNITFQTRTSNGTESWPNWAGGAITTFSDGSATKDITFSAAGFDTTTAAIKIPKGAMVTSAAMDVSGTAIQTLDQSQTTGGTSRNIIGGGGDVDQSEEKYYADSNIPYSNDWYAQSFKPTSAGIIINRVDLRMYKYGNPTGDVTVSIRSSLTGSDLTSKTLATSFFSGNAAWIRFDLTPYTLTTETTYYIVLRSSTGTSVDRYRFQFMYPSDYARGQIHISSDSGVSWETTPYANYDMMFRTFYGTTFTYGQSFTTGANTKNISAIEVLLNKYNYAGIGNVVLNVYATSGGAPTGAPIRTSTVAAPTGTNWVRFDFSSAVSVTPTTPYYFEVVAPSDATYETRMLGNYTTSDAKTGGNYYSVDDSTRTPTGYDAAYKVYATSYPTLPSLNIGNDGTIEWSSPTAFSSTETANIKSGLQSYINANCATGPGDCTIPINVTSNSAGKLQLKNLNIAYIFGYTNPLGSNITSPFGRYIQYRALLSTQDPTVTPVLNDVTITYIYGETVPPSITCDNCDSPDPVPSDSQITFSPTVYDAGSGISKTEICRDSSCTTIYCSNDIAVDATKSETRTCSFTPKTCDYANYSYWIRATDKVENQKTIEGGNFTVKKAGGCACSSSEECSAGSCIGGACVKVEAPNVNFAGGNILFPLGTTHTAIVSIKNPLQIADTIDVHLYGEPYKIGYWSWFQGHRYDTQKTDMNLSFNALETRNITVEILGAQLVNNYKLSVWVESKTTGLRGRNFRLISIGTARVGVLAGAAPDLSWLAFALIVILSCAIVWRKTKL